MPGDTGSEQAGVSSASSFRQGAEVGLYAQTTAADELVYIL